MEHHVIQDPQAFRAGVEASLGEEGQTRGIPSQGAIQEYCQMWPTASQALVLLQAMAPSIPSVGWFLEMAIPVVITWGNAAAKALCPGFGEPWMSRQDHNAPSDRG